VDGHNIRVLREDPPGKNFGVKAVATAKNWKFNPPTLNGKPVKAKTKVEMQFRSFEGGDGSGGRAQKPASLVAGN